MHVGVPVPAGYIIMVVRLCQRLAFASYTLSPPIDNGVCAVTFDSVCAVLLLLASRGVFVPVDSSRGCTGMSKK